MLDERVVIKVRDDERNLELNLGLQEFRKVIFVGKGSLGAIAFYEKEGHEQWRKVFAHFRPFLCVCKHVWTNGRTFVSYLCGSGSIIGDFGRNNEVARQGL